MGTLRVRPWRGHSGHGSGGPGVFPSPHPAPPAMGPSLSLSPPLSLSPRSCCPLVSLPDPGDIPVPPLLLPHVLRLLPPRGNLICPQPVLPSQVVSSQTCPHLAPAPALPSGSPTVLGEGSTPCVSCQCTRVPPALPCPLVPAQPRTSAPPGPPSRPSAGRGAKAAPSQPGCASTGSFWGEKEGLLA